MDNAQENIKSTSPDYDPMKPNAGDVISARYRWSDQKDEDPGEKIRPCIIIKAADDGSSMIIAPISTRKDWKAGDCIEISPEDRDAAGLHDSKRSWIKLTEVNKIDLPNLAVIPHVGPDGQMHWRRGRVSDEVLKQVTSEVAIRINDKSLKGTHVRADTGARIKLAGIRKIEQPQSETAPVETLQERIERRAADKVAQMTSTSPASKEKSASVR